LASPNSGGGISKLSRFCLRSDALSRRCNRSLSTTGEIRFARLARLTYGLKPPPARDGHARDAPLNATPGRLIATKASNGWFIDDPGCLMHVELQMTGLQSPLSLTKSSREGF
jgi:hypothetical protein